MKEKIIKTSTMSIILLMLDLVSKYFLYNKNYLSNLKFISPVFNMGISRGVQANMLIIIIVSIISLIIFSYLFKVKHISRIVFSILIAGTLGNLIDRIFLGGVRDFISIRSFPVFNIADILLNIGIVLILLKEITKKNKYISKRAGKI